MKKFQACDPKFYKLNLSLFISCLTKQMLLEPFDTAPQEPRDQWQDFPKVYTTTDINKAAAFRMIKSSQAPPYKIDVSQDLHEYVAFQEIPFFGAHFYYAFSPTEKLPKWKNFDRLKVPKKIVDKAAVALEAESPIKGRFSQKRADRHAKQPRAKTLMIAKPTATKHAKPTWEGPIEEEPEPEPEPPKKSMISIPTNGPVKAIPAGLQRRMAEAEKQSKFQTSSELNAW